MFSKSSILFAFLVLSAICVNQVRANPAIAHGYDTLEICLENCAQCKKMLGSWFEGPLCAESCVKYRGRLIPDCEDFASIAPFLNKL
ncbi:unnamed protein product, partial [Iphiclides podalirius]